MISLAIVCQDCGEDVEAENAIKISNGGWLCDTCCEQWRVGNDYY